MTETLADQIKALNLAPMNDAELGKYLGLPDAVAAKHVAKLSANERAVYDEMRALETLIPRWQAGIDPYPIDISVNRGRGRKRT